MKYRQQMEAVISIGVLFYRYFPVPYLRVVPLKIIAWFCVLVIRATKDPWS